MNIHTQSPSDIEVLENLQQAADAAPRLPILFVNGERMLPHTAIEQIEMGTIHPAVFEKLRGKYSASLSLAA